MMAKGIRFRVTPLLAALFFVLCCARAQAASDCKADLVAYLKGYDVDGYLFGVSEDESQTASFLTNKVINDAPATLGKADTGLVLRYTKTEDKATGATTTYRSEVVKKDSSLTLLVTDIGTNRTVSKLAFPTPGLACNPPGQFDSINACISQFNCDQRGALLCKANQTCQPQFAALTCCLKDGTAFSVHIIVRPTSIRCQLRDLIPDLDLVLSPN